MKVARLVKAGQVTVGDEPDPLPAEDESLVSVRAVGVCGSDLHWFDQGGIGSSRVERPLVLGHEMAGVALTGPHTGRTVAIDPAIPCEHCRYCLEGNTNLCSTIRFAGHDPVDGGLRELIAWPTRRLFPLPDQMTPAHGALLEPLGVAIHSLDLGHLKPDSSVVVVGCGPVGLLAVGFARRAGTGPLLAVEPLAHRREAALALGADAAISPDQAQVAAAELTRGGFDIAVEFAGTNDAIATAIDLVRPGGRVVLGGIPDDDVTAFPASAAQRKGLTLSLVRRMREVYPRAIEAGAQLDLESLVTERFALDQTPAAFESALKRTGIKVVIEP